MSGSVLILQPAHPIHQSIPRDRIRRPLGAAGGESLPALPWSDSSLAYSPSPNDRPAQMLECRHREDGAVERLVSPSLDQPPEPDGARVR